MKGDKHLTTFRHVGVIENFGIQFHRCRPVFIIYGNLSFTPHVRFGKGNVPALRHGRWIDLVKIIGGADQLRGAVNNLDLFG